jgi:phospholipid/cholesterol/gamma-HCH transport system substrate-binding protein
MANTYDKTRMTSDLRVGLISFAAIACLIAGITFAGGDKGLFLKKTSLLKARLTDVGGLKKGSSVTMNGMVVGRVTDIAFTDHHESAEPNGNHKVEVTMEIRADIRDRIKTDAITTVRTQGMLGDRYIDVPMGSDDSEALPEDKILIGAGAGDFDKALTEALKVLTETEKLLSAVNKQEGTVGQLLYDEEFYSHLLDITSELNDLLKDFKKNPRRYIKFSVF